MTNIEEKMNELAEYTALLDEVKATIAALQDDIKDYMTETGVDEVLTESGHKATWREVISNRFQSTEFKKIHGDLYKAFTKPTVTKRFTFSE